MARFWWGQKEKENKMGSMEQDGRNKGRMRHRFNDALLAKQLWRLITKPDILMRRVIKQKYFPRSDLLQTKVVALWL